MKNDFFRGLTTIKKEEADVILTGIPYDLGCSCGKGASLAPQIIRDLSSFLPPLTMDGKRIETKIFDNGDILSFDEIEEKGNEIFQLNKFSLFIGGDHSVTIPLQKSYLDVIKNKGLTPAVIHIDAHPDICDFYDGSKYSHACTNKRTLDNGLTDENLTMIGIRGYEEQEVDYFNNHPDIKVYQSSYINRLDKKGEKYIDQMIDEIIERNRGKAVYLSYDIDANDPSFAPGTGTPEAFGLNSVTLLKILKRLFIELDIKAFDIVEVSPALDSNNITSWLALKTIYEILPIINKR